MSIKRLGILMFVFCAALGSALSVSAQANDVINTIGGGTARVFNMVLALSVVLSAIVVVYGAILYIISFIKGSFRDDGKDWIKSGITGLLIVMTAWLTLSTINPNIFKFDWRNLPDLLLGNPGGGGGSGNGSQVLTYDQIPVGKLTENLLTGKMDCYDFDADGDPIPGDRIKDDDGKEFTAPTKLNHDRVDCYLNLADAAEKKALAAENLGKEISALMQQCSCQGKCDSPCNDGGKGCALPPVGTDCSNNQCGNADTASCATPDSFFKNAYLKDDTSLRCCPDDIKNQIRGYLKEHGDGPKNVLKQGDDPKKKVRPFMMVATKECPAEGCSGEYPKPYFGLDEFWSNKSGIAGMIEETATVNDKDVKYIDLGECKSCMGRCECAPDDKACLKEQPKCQEAKSKCMVEKLKCMEETKWGQLNLYEQLTYLNEKMGEIKSSIEVDKIKLQRGAESVASCPLVKSYLEFSKIDESTNRQEVNLAINGDSTEPEGYCNGFNYASSHCHQKCTDMCPITKDDLSCFDDCSSGNACDPKRLDYQECMAKKSTCTATCYNKRKCTYNSNFENFGSCMNSCKGGCEDTCAAKYLPCSPEFNQCQQSCKEDSQCVMDNLTSCVIDPVALGNCSDVAKGVAGANDEFLEGRIKQCIEDAYSCGAGSEQQAGYPECLKKPEQQTIFSSSYIYQHPKDEVCPLPVTGPQADPDYSQTECIEGNPETAKCPSGSACPYCKCDDIDKKLTFTLENYVNPYEVDACTGGTPSYGAYCGTTITKEIKEYRVVGPECSEPAFNGDPLTFYCRKDWWNEEDTKRRQNLGQNSDPSKTLVCSRADEIPVGTLVDNAFAWQEEFKTTSDKVYNPLLNVLSMMKKISEGRSYCSCESKYESGNPICRACCNYVPGMESEDEEGNSLSTPASCSFEACKGHSCQQMINWLAELINRHRDMKEGLIDFMAYAMEEHRSDVLKELTYSRNKMADFSAVQNETTKEKGRLLNCQQILDDVIYPITDPSNTTIIEQNPVYHYCYGLMASKVSDKAPEAPVQADNWFYCRTTN